jgi:uncharacterized protein YgfB (UPF0149 family)
MPDSASASFAAGLATVRGYWERLPPEYQADFTKAVDDLADLAEAQVKAAADAQAQKFGGPLLGGLARGVTDAALAKLYAQLKDELAAFETRSSASQGA